MQRINFQQHLVKSDDADLSADQIALIGAGFFGGLLFIAAVLTVWNSVTSGQLADANAEHKQLSSQMDGMTQTLAGSSQQQIETLQRQVKERKAMLASLRADRSDERIAFSSRLRGLGRQVVDGLWLDQIVINETGNALNIGGKTVKAELVPRYLRALSSDAVFQGLRFDVMKINGPDLSDANPQSQELSFEVLALRDLTAGSGLPVSN